MATMTATDTRMKTAGPIQLDLTVKALPETARDVETLEEFLGMDCSCCEVEAILGVHGGKGWNLMIKVSARHLDRVMKFFK